MKRILLYPLLFVLICAGPAFAQLGMPAGFAQIFVRHVVSLTVQAPGPSATLFNSPYYSCVRNFYVSTTGSDSNAGTSTGAAWATIAHADSAARQGGDCINVAPGSYANFNSNLTYGGSSASSTGYVVYRCTTPAFISGTGCEITQNYKAVCAGYNCSGVYPNYIIIDGFNFVLTTKSTNGSDTAIVCQQPATNTSSLGCHHWMVLNNVITGHGGGGIGFLSTEYSIISHNVVNQNAQTCAYGQSGIMLVDQEEVSGYTRTPDDSNSSNNAALNLIGIQGPAFPFHNLVAWNLVSNNFQTCSGGTDGNGIIIDTNANTGCNSTGITGFTTYGGTNLIDFNIAYNNGGTGIHVFSSVGTTVANNSLYYNFSDAKQAAYNRSNANVQCGSATDGTGAGTDIFINNVSYNIPSGLSCTGNYPGSLEPYGIGGDGTNLDAEYNAPGHNVGGTLGTPCNADSQELVNGTVTSTPSGNTTQQPGDPLWDCGTNKCNANPLWVAVGNVSSGSELVPPEGVNFALQAGSPEINAGVSESYLPAQSVDAGACYHSLSSCPAIGPIAMAGTPVYTGETAVTGTSQTISFTQSASGDLVVLGVALCQTSSCVATGSNVVSSVTDTLGNSCNRVIGVSDATDVRSEIWECPATVGSGSDTYTITYSGAPAYSWVTISEWKNAALTSPGEVANSAVWTSATGSQSVSTSGATTGNSEMVYSMIQNGYMPGNISSFGQTQIANGTDEYQIVSAKGVQTNSYTLSGYNSLTALIVAFKGGQ